MSRRAVFVLIAAALVAMLATNLTTYHRAEAQEAGNVVLTVRNVTGGQPLTPAVVVVHDGGADLLPENAEDLAGLEELAESGQPAALAASLRDVAGVKARAMAIRCFSPPDSATPFSPATVSNGKESMISWRAAPRILSQANLST